VKPGEKAQAKVGWGGVGGSVGRSSRKIVHKGSLAYSLQSPGFLTLTNSKGQVPKGNFGKVEFLKLKSFFFLFFQFSVFSLFFYHPAQILFTLWETR
jgi:hypothetical protein